MLHYLVQFLTNIIILYHLVDFFTAKRRYQHKFKIVLGFAILISGILTGVSIVSFEAVTYFNGM